MVNFVASPAVNPGVNTPLFGGQPVRIWTPGVPLLSPRRGGGEGGNVVEGARGGQESIVRAQPPPPPATLPGCIPLDRRNPAEGWTAHSINSGLSSPMARNVNAIMAAVNGTKTKKRVTFLNESAASSGRTTKSATPQKGIQERRIERRPARNPYRKSETQTRRKVFPARATKSAAAASSNASVTGNQRRWNFPTRLEEFQKPEVEDMFNDFWKTVEDHQMESYFRDFWQSVKDPDDKMERYSGQFWEAVNKEQDHVIDVNEFWRRMEGKSRKDSPKENLAADFWKMIENYQQRQSLDEAVMAGHFLRMVESTQSCQHEARPWEAPSRDMWKLISHEEKRLIDDRLSPEALAGDFFKLTADDKCKMNAVNDRELVAGQFWRMIEKKSNDGKEEIKFVADSSGNVFRKFKGYEVTGNRRESMADAKMVNNFFSMVDEDQRNTEATAEILAGDFWRMMNESKNHESEIEYVADSSGNIFRNHKGYQITGKPTKTATEAEWVRQFFNMLEKEQRNDEAKVETYAGNFWKMINDSQAQTERKVKEAAVGDFWKMVEFTENLRRKRETMRRLSASKREEEAASASPFIASATPKKSSADKKEGARRTALLFACSTLEEQAYYVLASDYQDPQGQGGRKRTTSSSSLYSVKEEEEFRPEVSEASCPRHQFRVTPHYDSLQLGAPKSAATKTGSGVILVALRKKKKSIKPQQCHRQNMVAQERRGSVTRRNRIPSISAIGSNNDRKCGRKTW